ncbi:MAG: hypothetical protein M1830_005174 [Pleopsidium flavum]|nr:MAG: hypothetical protein M1830_005174 [Pleopsidium flavum]
MPQGTTALHPAVASKLLWQTLYVISKPNLAMCGPFPGVNPKLCTYPLLSHSSSLQRSNPRTSCRTFTATPLFLKKGGKENNKRNVEVAAAATADVDPFDFTQLEAGIQKAIDKLKDELSKLRAGGRFNPEILEALRVQLVKGSKETVRLGELAQIVPKGGRAVIVMVGEKDHVKSITSTIQTSNLSLTPQLDPQTPTHLTIPIPPPTQQSRMEALQTAIKAGEQAGMAVRNARGVQQKKMRAMQVAKTVRPDDLKKAGEGMEKVVERGHGEVQKVVDGAKRVLERG